MPATRIYLSPPHMGGKELDLVREAFDTNWVAPAGPHLRRFEEEFCELVDSPSALAVSSGTAALHLALRVVGVGAGDEVLCSTLTFVASVNPIVYQGGRPVFIDSEEASWNMDPSLLEAELHACARRGRLPKAVILVHLYGQSADLDPIQAACEAYGVPLIEDAAEALGATYKGTAPGTRGLFGIFSFNGNKIITTSGGGMLVSTRTDLVDEARALATQARESAPHYEHVRVGYNYRLSNVLAAIGRGQLRVLGDHVEARRANCEAYRRRLQGVPGLTLMPETPWGCATRWLTVILVDPTLFGVDREVIRLALRAQGIESRPVWKPMHRQPVFKDCRRRGGGVAERLFEQGLCLPSGSQLTEAQIEEVVSLLLAARRREVKAV